MNYQDASLPVNRTINQHRWLTALVLSIAVHVLVIVGVIWVWPSASSKGQGQVMMLEAVHEQTHIQVSTRANQASEAISEISHQIKPPQKAVQENGQGQQTKPTASLPQPTKIQQRQANASSSNKGDLVDQSGKAQSPQEHYQQQLLKHLLNKMGSAPITGKANIKLTLMSAGIAIQVTIELIEGSPRYQQWLKSKVLNANPFPAIPKELGVSQFQTSIPIEHANTEHTR